MGLGARRDEIWDSNPSIWRGKQGKRERGWMEDIWGNRGKIKESEREREIHVDRQRDRQRDRHTERQTERDRHRERQTEKERDRQRERQTEKETDREIDRDRERQKNWSE